jgi:hypothetical protein
MKWYDRTIRITGGVLLSGLVIVMFLNYNFPER